MVIIITNDLSPKWFPSIFCKRPGPSQSSPSTSYSLYLRKGIKKDADLFLPFYIESTSRLQRRDYADFLYSTKRWTGDISSLFLWDSFQISSHIFQLQISSHFSVMVRWSPSVIGWDRTQLRFIKMLFSITTVRKPLLSRLFRYCVFSLELRSDLQSHHNIRVSELLLTTPAV